MNGDYQMAIMYYHKAVELRYQPSAPIVLPIRIEKEDSGTCCFIINAYDVNNSSINFFNVPAAFCGSLPSWHDPAFQFVVLNPNDMYMNIQNIYLNVLEYHNVTIRNSNCWAGGGSMRRFYCNINPKVGSYICKPLSEDYDFITLKPGGQETETIDIQVKADQPGIYKLGISLDYSIGDTKNRTTTVEAPYLIGFVN